MQTLFMILLAGSMIGVVAVLALGLIAMTLDGDFNKKYGNRMMRARVILQGFALLFFVLAIASGVGK